MKPPAERGGQDGGTPVRLSFQEATESPCLSCPTSPCCTNLPLDTFRVTTLAELDRARYLLNFDRIELGLAATGDWTAYYRYPCRFLDRDTYGCTIHHDPNQPNLCSQYNPFNCWYKDALNERTPDTFVRVDRQRLEWLVERIEFDADRNIVAVPAWPVMVEAFASLDVTEQGRFDDAPQQDPAFADWQRTAVELGRTRSKKAAVFDTAPSPVDPTKPCSGCAAVCCAMLVFPLAAPADSERLDHIRFCLGFPGVEVSVDREGLWTIAVRSTCRHLSHGRCSVFGEPERPLRCQYYDEHQCVYRRDFIPARPADRVRIRHEEFDTLAGLFGFDADGTALEVPDLDEIRRAVEAEWVAASS